ncbi:transcription elongation factor Spt6 [Dothidotthia symphoricarpi CBS 119687]|uniref:Transcription elongation factor Spt6 n=1 Tax=Dothidotthia symphoricarpi CBS 119687 TaxID=1392245 RepID=A0A6A6ASC1_9PLEO|nr:transcription elongation factor Spt6 [Dothidotthia symphoricarpi CBS 119687]KAF2133834.1 transcription elongation factor Spt6 [Dothidotthia symphoricarpi CBS 119687]
MATKDLFDLDAALGSEEEDEDFDEEMGEARPKKSNGANGIDDSSEEEDEDDDERLAEEGAGFIATEDEEEEEEARRERRRRKKRKNREADEALDEEDLDLIGIEIERPEETQTRFKRLKRGHKERVKSRGVDDIFSDEEVNEDIDPRGVGMDEFSGFIEDDQFEDEIEDDRDVTQPGINLITQGLQAAGLDEGAEEDYRAAFGDGTDYDWALDMQEAEEEEQTGEGRELQLKDVFEPSQLQERMLTDEDNVIREVDVPERLQLARKPFRELELTPEDMQSRLTEEALWITKLLWPKKGLPGYFQQPFQKAVRKVLEFINLEDYEVPFIFNHRKDYLIHAPSDNDDNDDPDNPPPMDARPERLLNQSDLWEVFDLDLKFRAFAEKRDALRQNYDNVRSVYPDITDNEIEDLTQKAVTIEEIQELQDYLHYRYSQEMNEVRQEVNGAQKRANNARNFFDKLRGGKAHLFVKAIGITPDDFAKKAEGTSRGSQVVEDPPYKVEELADQMAQAPETGVSLLRSAKLLFVQDLFMSSRLRRFLRGSFYQNAVIDCIRTDKGMRKITEDHPYYEFKYLRGQTFLDLNGRPDLFLKMLKAEQESLVQVRISMGNYDKFKAKLQDKIVSDNVSEVSETWNALRKEVLEIALDKLQGIIANGVKETLRARCEDELASRARENYYNKLDQAPYRPKSSPLGSVPNVLCLSHGKGERGDAVMWAYVENDGRVLEQGKLVDMKLGNPERNIPDGQDIANLVDAIQRRRPDAIGVSGWSVETRRLYKDIQEIVSQHNLTGSTYEDENTNAERSDPLDVVMVNDEVARLYYNSARAAIEFPKYAPLTRYCISLGRYLQNPLAEYASLGKDVVSIPFVQDQTLIPPEKLLDRLETAMVDMVNLVGVDLPEHYDDPYMSKLLPYVCGLGPRKADRMVKAIQANGEEILSRFDLLGVSENSSRELKAAMGPKVFQNCASFLFIVYDQSEESSDYLDYTRVHPEDYDLARKMVADALNMDEEDVKAEVDDGGASAVVRKMVKEENTDLVNDLALEDYAAEIEKNFGQRKRATLETIRAELDAPYEEIRQIFALMTGDEMFTMLTGETKETLYEGMVIPVTIKRTFQDHIEAKLECGIDGGVSESEFPEGVGSGGQEPRHVFQPHQTVRARILYLNRKALSAQLSLRADLIRQPMPRAIDRIPGEWDEQQEAADKKAAAKEKEVASGRPNRVVNHPLFFQFNATQAEEYLGTKEPGELVIRPSSKGFNHLVVTWKVSASAYQHLDVLELNKPNQFSLGKKLTIGKSVYTDLDELIVNHVEAMARKVTEITRDERFQNGTKEETDLWLETYCKANPSRSMYAFCSMPKHPGHFWICFQMGDNAPKGAWGIKVVPNAFELQKNLYPNMMALKNGFKMLIGAKAAQANGPRR